MEEVKKDCDYQKVGELVLTVLDIFGETVRGQLIHKVYVSKDNENRTKITLKDGKKRFREADECKETVRRKMKKIDCSDYSVEELEAAQRQLKQFCEIVNEDNFLQITLRN